MKKVKSFHRQLGDELVISCLQMLLKENKEEPNNTNFDLRIVKAKKTFRITISDFDLKYPVFDYEGVKFSVYEIPFVFVEEHIEIKLLKLPPFNHIP